MTEPDKFIPKGNPLPVQQLNDLAQDVSEAEIKRSVNQASPKLKEFLQAKSE